MSNYSYPNLKKPNPEDVVMRYTNLAQFVWVASREQLPMTRIDQFRDPFEGSAPKSMIDQQLLIQGGRNQMEQMNPALRNHYQKSGKPNTLRANSADVWTEMTDRRRNRTHSTHASCWRKGAESEGMWRLYCGEKEGVALRTTFRLLEESIANTQVIAGEIQYGDYKTIAPFTNDLDHVMYKREGFAFEQEVRLLKSDEEHYEKLSQGLKIDELERCMPIDWNLKATVQNIIVSPYAESWYFDAVREVARRVDGDLEECVKWSSLRDTPFF